VGGRGCHRDYPHDEFPLINQAGDLVTVANPSTVAPNVPQQHCKHASSFMHKAVTGVHNIAAQ
jgi:hypothetical protein